MSCLSSESVPTKFPSNTINPKALSGGDTTVIATSKRAFALPLANSIDYPQTIIDTGEYLTQMNSENFNKNNLAVKQAFTALPKIYKSEIANKFFTVYLQDNISTTLRSNIEFCCPILWEVLPKDSRQQIGKRFDKEIIAGDKTNMDKGIDFFSFIRGMRYVSTIYNEQLIYDH